MVRGTAPVSQNAITKGTVEKSEKDGTTKNYKSIRYSKTNSIQMGFHLRTYLKFRIFAILHIFHDLALNSLCL